ncbi:hypothetical protein DV735_g2291, partial [Chaetothyriales sp. CBS 134920]
MEAPAHLLYKQTTRSRWRRIAIIVVVVIAALCALIIPLAVVLPGKGRPHGEPSSVLLPLYVYPSPGAWDPLHEVLDSHPLLHFTVIINPEDGPGSSDEPTVDYVVAVKNLTSYDNVRLVGYVRTQWAERNITEVLREVQVYSNWSTLNGSASGTGPLTMDGIFFDEAPSVYTAQTHEYLQTINRAVKDAPGLGGNRTIVHNPGTAPDPRFDDLDTDIIVAFEQSSDYFHSSKSNITALSLDRSHYAFVIHSAPSKDSKLRNLVATMSQRAQYLFATELTSNYYESFSNDWTTFIAARSAARKLRSPSLIGRPPKPAPLAPITGKKTGVSRNINSLSWRTSKKQPKTLWVVSSVPPVSLPATGEHGQFSTPPGTRKPQGLDSSLPDATYSIEIPKLNALANVTTVGYVRIDYCKRPFETVKEDIEKYANWSTVEGLGIQGIFFDETPNLYSPDVVKYLADMDEIVKAEQGILGDRLVIHNPGTIPDPDLASGLRDQAAPDLVAVVEDSFANYVSTALQDRLESLCRPPHFSRHNICYIVHSVPLSLQAQLARRLCDRASFLFITDRCSHFYEGFGHGWMDFLDAIGPPEEERKKVDA